MSRRNRQERDSGRRLERPSKAVSEARDIDRTSSVNEKEQSFLSDDEQNEDSTLGMSLDDIFAKKWSKLTSASCPQHPTPVTPKLNGDRDPSLRYPSPSFPGWLSPAWSGKRIFLNLG